VLYLSRHGLRLDKVIKSYQGGPNPPIHHSGIQKLIDNSNKIEKLDAIFCSPFIRCVQSAHYMNKHNAPIYIEYGLSETLRAKWFEKCGYNPLNRLNNSTELSHHYYNVDPQYTTAIHQKFPESRRDSRQRTHAFMKWFRKSPYWEKDVLLVGHGFSIKDCLNSLDLKPPYQGWTRSYPSMGHLFSFDKNKIEDSEKEQKDLPKIDDQGVRPVF
jgi:broad specificity phosphatase PhoE